MKTVTAAGLKSNLSGYLEMANNGEVFIVAKNGRKICEIHPSIEAKLAIFDSLTGIASGVVFDR